jgi:hypothetical protein
MPPTHRTPATDAKGFALLELFTSEGCSSCPRADDLLANVQAEAKDQPIYVLAYHVDYWDRLGWRDKFSNPLFSARQRTYAGHLQSGSVYTPQIVINGTKECLDWDATTLHENISHALTTAAEATLDLHVTQSNRSLTVKYQATGKTHAHQLLIALIQKHAVNKISRGENEGRTLTHAQIVRELVTINLKTGPQGTQVIEAPPDFTGNGWKIVGFLQNTTSGVVTAATSTPL